MLAGVDDVAQYHLDGCQDDIVGGAGIDVVEGKDYLAFLGLEVLDLKFPTPVGFPFRFDTVDEGAR
jgi:hypothetical protein